MHSFELRKYRYDFNENGEITITSLENNAPPEFIGKYLSFSQNHDQKVDNKIESLISGKLYGTEIDKLNDISEGLQLQTIASSLSTHHQSEDEIRRQFITYCQLCFGVVSFTKCPYNLSMWGLYTDNSGVFVDYKSAELITSVRSKSTINITNLFPVRYEEDYKGYAEELYNLNAEELWHKLFPALSTKLAVWKSENEYRLLAFKKGDEEEQLFKTRLRRWKPEKTVGHISRHLDFEVSSIKRIILAFHFFDFEINSFISEEGVSVVSFTVPKHQLGKSKTALLEFCDLRKIPVFKIDMTIQEPITFLLDMKDQGDRFAFEYNKEKPYTKDKDYR